MPRRCSVCGHPQRGGIDSALLAGEPYRHIAGRFGTSTGALQRHKQDHIPSLLARAEEAKQVARADGLLDRLLELSRETATILKEARGADDNELALKAIARAERQIELQARLLGELKDGQTVNILIMPEWHSIRAVLVAALTPFPQARAAVAEALRRIDGAGA